jgi:hypothetical protein
MSARRAAVNIAAHSSAMKRKPAATQSQRLRPLQREDAFRGVSRIT